MHSSSDLKFDTFGEFDGLISMYLLSAFKASLALYCKTCPDLFTEKLQNKLSHLEFNDSFFI